MTEFKDKCYFDERLKNALYEIRKAQIVLANFDENNENIKIAINLNNIYGRVDSIIKKLDIH